MLPSSQVHLESTGYFVSLKVCQDDEERNWNVVVDIVAYSAAAAKGRGVPATSIVQQVLRPKVGANKFKALVRTSAFQHALPP